MVDAFMESDPGKLSEKCYSQCLIAKESCEQVQHPMQTARQQAGLLLTCLQPPIEADRNDEKFKKFCNIMYKEDEKLKQLCIEILKEYLHIGE